MTKLGAAGVSVSLQKGIKLPAEAELSDETRKIVEGCQQLQELDNDMTTDFILPESKLPSALKPEQPPDNDFVEPPSVWQDVPPWEGAYAAYVANLVWGFRKADSSNIPDQESIPKPIEPDYDKETATAHEKEATPWQCRACSFFNEPTAQDICSLCKTPRS